MPERAAIQQMTRSCNLNIYITKLNRHNALSVRGKYKVKGYLLHEGPICPLSSRTPRRISKRLHMEVIAATSGHICDDGTFACHLGKAFMMHLVSVFILILHTHTTFSVINPIVLSWTGDVTPTSRKTITELKYHMEVAIGPFLTILEARLC